MKKYCCNCSAELPTHVGVGRGNGARRCRDGKYRCPGCMPEYVERRKQAYDTNHHLKNSYGITTQTYLALVEQQKGRCKICGKVPLKLVVDHDHITGKVRSLLCYNCNTGLGQFEDNLDMLLKAVEYLKQHSS